jgi:S-adenosylhomocysteine hydrolase
MRYILSIILIGVIGTNCFSQGSWDIGYVEIDSLNSDYLNTQIKLDFKHDWLKIKKPEKRSVRHYVMPEDTAYILINNGKTVLTERREIYVDHGSFNNQYLEIENYDKNISKRIYDTEIVQLEKDRMMIRVVIQYYEMKNEKIKEELESETVEFWIDKDKLDGIMIKK